MNLKMTDRKFFCGETVKRPCLVLDFLQAGPPLPRRFAEWERCLRHGDGFSLFGGVVCRHRGLNFSRLPTRTLAGRDADGCLALCCAATQHGVTFFGGGRALLAASLPKRRRLIASDRGQPGGYAKN